MRTFNKLVWAEFKVTLRDPPVALVAIIFPAVVVAVFGAITSPAHSDDPLRFFYQPMSLSMGLGVLAFSLMATELATYREKGILRRLAVTPVGPTRLLAAQLVVNATIAVTAIAAVVAVGTLGFGFPWPGNIPGFLVTIVVGLAALLGIGLGIAALAPTARVATAIGVGFYFANLVVGGIFVPRESLPPSLARLTDYAPLGAMLQSLQRTWSGEWPTATGLLVLAGCAVVSAGFAVRFFRWQ